VYTHSQEARNEYSHLTAQLPEVEVAQQSEPTQDTTPAPYLVGATCIHTHTYTSLLVGAIRIHTPGILHGGFCLFKFMRNVAEPAARCFHEQEDPFSAATV